MQKAKQVIVIGGGAAGFFFAINCAQQHPDYQITILEKSPKVLEKVRISGGGRCNVTHQCFEPKPLTRFYPRGEKELLGPFHQFMPQHTIAWFEERGVKIKAEEDGRMFPTTDNSESIIQCFLNEAKRWNVRVETLLGVEALKQDENKQWQVITNREKTYSADIVFIATGSASKMWDILGGLNYKLQPAVPSLFTFNIKDPRITGLLGLSVPNAIVTVKGEKLQANGPLLITHWGMSGPAVLRLSAWGARLLKAKNHQFELLVNWTGEFDLASMKTELRDIKITAPKKTILANNLFQIPMRLWKSLGVASGITESDKWADLSNQKIDALAMELTQGLFRVNGKSTNKDEFVTCGGLVLNQIDFKTMQSKLHEGLFFGGEVLDIDAITGGFNFQAAWTTAWIAAQNC